VLFKSEPRALASGQRNNDTISANNEGFMGQRSYDYRIRCILPKHRPLANARGSDEKITAHSLNTWDADRLRLRLGQQRTYGSESFTVYRTGAMQV
jgi:hypothetical protein